MRDAFLLDPDIVFLNHGSFGACPKPVFESYQRWQLELERNPVAFLGRRSGALLRRRTPSIGCLSRRVRRRPGLPAQCHPRRQHRRALAGPAAGRRSAGHRPRVRRLRRDLGIRLPPARRPVPSHYSAPALRPGPVDEAPARRGDAANARHLCQPHHVDHGARLPRAGAVRRRSPAGHHDTDRRCPRTGPDRARPRRGGRRLLHRQLPQVAVCTQGRRRSCTRGPNGRPNSTRAS